MLLAVEGTYKDGKVDLTEAPKGVREARVIVTFLTESRSVGRMMRLGRFAGPNMSTEEDFKIAEWHGDSGTDE